MTVVYWSTVADRYNLPNPNGNYKYHFILQTKCNYEFLNKLTINACFPKCNLPVGLYNGQGLFYLAAELRCPPNEIRESGELYLHAPLPVFPIRASYRVIFT